MQQRLLQWLRCPECRAHLELAAPDALECGGCARRFAVRGDVPIFTSEPSATAAAFGYLWGEQAARVRPPQSVTPYHLHQLHDALGAPHLTGLIIDGGCGDGVDLAMLALDPDCEVVGVELSNGGSPRREPEPGGSPAHTSCRVTC